MKPMTASSETAFPPAALDWLVDAPDARVLALGRTCAPLMATLASRGAKLTANDPEPTGVRRLLAHAPRALPAVAEAAQLPFAASTFDVVLINQSAHTLDVERVPDELARVLRPGGHLAIAYTIRDDSVPWVRRLVKAMQGVDPNAMTGAYGAQSVDELIDRPYFPIVERRDFRLWSPISRAGMLQMVRRRFPKLDAARLDPLLDEVGTLYDTSARVPDPLLLPYKVACWRARVDHTHLEASPDTDNGLTISL